MGLGSDESFLHFGAFDKIKSPRLSEAEKATVQTNAGSANRGAINLRPAGIRKHRLGFLPAQLNLESKPRLYRHVEKFLLPKNLLHQPLVSPRMHPLGPTPTHRAIGVQLRERLVAPPQRSI